MPPIRDTLGLRYRSNILRIPPCSYHNEFDTFVNAILCVNPDSFGIKSKRILGLDSFKPIENIAHNNSTSNSDGKSTNHKKG